LKTLLGIPKENDGYAKNVVDQYYYEDEFDTQREEDHDNDKYPGLSDKDLINV
jgi:hypothetical protein